MAELEKLQMYIDGARVDAAGGEAFESLNPFTGKAWATVPRGGPEDAERAVAAAKKAFTSGDWPAMTPTARGHLLRKLGDLIAENAERLAKIEVQDNGKLMAEMGMQLQYTPQWFYYFAGLADKIEGAVLPIDKPDMFTYTRHEPLGVITMITPWNSPILLLTWKLAPALAAGNTVVLKPSEFTSASSLAFADLMEQAGFPKGVFNVVTGYGAEIGETLVTHDDVAKIAFTGGGQSGAHVYEKAAAGLKKVSLELGGKSPNIVFADCNIDNAVKGAISGIFAATGQTCIAGSRLLVEESIHNEFVDKIVDFAKTARMGDPMSMDTQVGPVTTMPQYEKILGYLDVAREDGAECVLGGAKADRPECGDGWFVEPTIYTGVNNQMRIAQEEVFGPVLSIIPFRDDEEAIEIANDVVYGLASGVWTSSIERAIEIPKRINAGTVWVNTYRAVSYMAPFGGYKRSGLGRESGQDAIYEYMQTKTVWISTASDVPDPFVLK
ncbi:MAG: aldehyde dehydrogenase [Rhodospirillaceae bacterium]|jgi:aldehyde dehydrogenase (NAD+)|nr:aldehyde dehydrogenase [Rhodospirillaceae bacterium]MBT4751292.1 aldehyde dehydrogenase [Rhodospirillaceae bacterium]MBT5298173.1 aldehyde dehydrogenase [Rhodospirillaceae bacterium]MBT5512636.1 aldehyde dehydrogenase [Rhodospirillaceae bacterium]MBT6086052.1 aldehyde dehydrogenase [Rhodospirillaceae bacterium]